MIYYFLIGIIALVLALCMIDAEGLIIYKVLIIIMFLLFAFVKSNVDMGAYLDFYDRINGLSDIAVTDPAFGLLMLTGKMIGLDYSGFLVYLGIIGLLFLSFVFRHYSPCPAIALALYFIFDYAAEIIQIRAFMSEIVMYILMMDIIEKDEFHWKRFFITLTIGVLFHSTSIFFLLLILPVLIKSRRKLYTIVLIGCLLVPSVSIILRFFPIPILRDKLQYYVISQREGISFSALIYVMLFLLVSIWVGHIAKHERDFIWRPKLQKLMNIHVIALIACVLLIYFSSNFYRILRTVMVVDSLALGRYYKEKGKLTLSHRVILSVCVLIFFVGFEMWGGSWKGIMESNSLFCSIMQFV